MTVKIKTWEAMEEEFGLDTLDDIDCIDCFTQTMEERLPEDRIIEVNRIKTLGYSASYNWNNDWFISDDMIEEIIE